MKGGNVTLTIYRMHKPVSYKTWTTKHAICPLDGKRTWLELDLFLILNFHREVQFCLIETSCDKLVGNNSLLLKQIFNSFHLEIFKQNISIFKYIMVVYLENCYTVSLWTIENPLKKYVSCIQGYLLSPSKIKSYMHIFNPNLTQAHPVHYVAPSSSLCEES